MEVFSKFKQWNILKLSSEVYEWTLKLPRMMSFNLFHGAKYEFYNKYL